jgi:fructosamine-3-kinase
MMLSNKKISQLIKKAGLKDCKISPVGSGHYNDSYYLDSDTERFVLRIAPPDNVPKLFYEIDMMKSEPAIHKLVKEHTDIPVPEIIFYDFSRQTLDTDYLIMNYLSGSPGYFDEKQLGRFVRQLHGIKSDICGYPERKAPTGKSWPQIFNTYTELIFKDCLSCEVIDEKEYDYFLSRYKKHQNAIEQVAPSLLHLDLWSQNILAVNGEITGILDFDRGLYGDIELEFAVLDTYGYSTDEFFEGYGLARLADRSAQIRQRLYIVYELIKYAFIRTTRNKNFSTGRNHVAQCRRILREIE